MTAGPVVPPLPSQPVDVARLEALEAQATSGPWSFYFGDLWCGVTADELAHADRLSAELNYSDEAQDIYEKSEHVFHGDPREPADAQFIAAVRNAAPSLLAAYRERDELLATVERVEALAAKYESIGRLTDAMFLRAALGRTDVPPGVLPEAMMAAFDD